MIMDSDYTPLIILAIIAIAIFIVGTSFHLFALAGTTPSMNDYLTASVKGTPTTQSLGFNTTYLGSLYVPFATTGTTTITFTGNQNFTSCAGSPGNYYGCGAVTSTWVGGSNPAYTATIPVTGVQYTIGGQPLRYELFVNGNDAGAIQSINNWNTASADHGSPDGSPSSVSFDIVIPNSLLSIASFNASNNVNNIEVKSGGNDIANFQLYMLASPTPTVQGSLSPPVTPITPSQSGAQLATPSTVQNALNQGPNSTQSIVIVIVAVLVLGAFYLEVK